MPHGFSPDDLPDPDLDLWNRFPWIISNNCYSHALNSPLTFRELQRWKAGDPGWRSGFKKLDKQTGSDTFRSYLAKAISGDGSAYLGPRLTPLPGHYPMLVWTLAHEGEDGFHVARLNKNGRWTEGQICGPVRERDDLALWETDPAVINPNLNFLGFWAVPKGGLAIIKGRTVDALQGTFRTKSEFVREVRDACFDLTTRRLNVEPNYYRTALDVMRYMTPVF